MKVVFFTMFIVHKSNNAVNISFNCDCFVHMMYVKCTYIHGLQRYEVYV